MVLSPPKWRELECSCGFVVRFEENIKHNKLWFTLGFGCILNASCYPQNIIYRIEFSSYLHIKDRKVHGMTSSPRVQQMQILSCKLCFVDNNSHLKYIKKTSSSKKNQNATSITKLGFCSLFSTQQLFFLELRNTNLFAEAKIGNQEK